MEIFCYTNYIYICTKKICNLGTTVCLLCSLAVINFCVFFLNVFPDNTCVSVCVCVCVCLCVCVCVCVLCVGTASVPVTRARRLRQSPYGLDGVRISVS